MNLCRLESWSQGELWICRCHKKIFLRCKFVAYHTNSEQIVHWHQDLIVGRRNGRLTLSRPHHQSITPSPSQWVEAPPAPVSLSKSCESRYCKDKSLLNLLALQVLNIKTKLMQLLRPIKIIRIIFGQVLPALHASWKYFSRERKGFGSYDLNFPLKNYHRAEASSRPIIWELSSISFILKTFWGLWDYRLWSGVLATSNISN